MDGNKDSSSYRVQHSGHRDIVDEGEVEEGQVQVPIWNLIQFQTIHLN